MNDVATPPFMELQRQFAAHIRDPANHPRPGDVDARRMAVYVELFFRSLEQHLAAGFPVIRRITPDERWHALVREFMVRHRCRTPLFPQIGREFADFLEATLVTLAHPPFLGELAHYEYLEVTVSLSEDDATPPLAADASVLASRPRLSSSAHVVQYRFPVHRIGPGAQPDTAPATPTSLLVYRAPDDRVRFMELNALSFAFLELLRIAPGQPAGDVLAALAESIAHPRPDEVLAAGETLLRDLYDRTVLVAMQ